MKALFDLPDIAPPRDRERDCQVIALRLASPKRSAAEQHDASSLALFIAANEPGFASLEARP